jgi:electron transfer flavoprotein beta subunit
VIAACLKWVDRRPEVDPLTGDVHVDGRSSGASDADQAALEWALRTGAAWDHDVVVLTAGPAGAESVLRLALAVGATKAIRVDVPAGAPSEAVAAGLAPLLSGCEVVWCGDVSLDRGTGSVPAYLAAHLGAAQALGLVEVDVGPPGTLTALRRLDGGRRERLCVTAPGVCSVEGAAARLRRSSLAATLSARTAAIDVRPAPAPVPAPPVSTRPYRPRARVLPPPDGATALERIAALTRPATATAHGQPVVLEPAAAADRVLEALRTWGYLDG